MTRFILPFALLLACGAASAQSWPAKPIRYIVPTGPGLATDIMARLMAEPMSKLLGQPIVVDNIAGAAGIIGSQALAKSAPDGYTMMIAPAGSLVNNQFQFKSLPYDPVKDFQPVAMVVDNGPLSVAVNASLPVSSLAELVTYVKARPGAVSYARDASSGLAEVIGKLLNKRGGLDAVEISYKTTAQALQDTVSGRTQYMIGSPAAVAGMVKAGKLRRLAVTSPKRFPGLPDLPTLAETFPNLVVQGWFALVVPAGTPRDIVMRLNGAVDQALKDPPLVERMTQFGLGSSGAGSPESTAEFVRVERERWRGIVAELGIKPQ